MKKKTFNWAVIGSGTIANTVAKEITKTKRHNVVTCYSRNAKSSGKFCKKFGADNYDNLKEAVCDERVDGIYIASPHGVHYKHIMECLEYKKPILCEKSFTLNHKEAKACIDKAVENKTFLAEAMWLYHNKTILKVKEWIDSGAIGNVVSINADFSVLNFKLFAKERIFKNKCGGGALLDLGVYPISLAYYMCNKTAPSNITSLLNIKSKVDISDDINLTIGNVNCHLTANICKGTSGLATIYGDKGRISFSRSFAPKSATLHTNDGKSKTFKAKVGYIYQFDNIAEEIKNNALESKIVTHADTLCVMQIMDTIRGQHNFVYKNELK